MYCTFILLWLQGDFLTYLADWKKEVYSDKSLSLTEKGKMILSRETLEGLTVTGTFYTLARDHFALHTLYLPHPVIFLPFPHYPRSLNDFVFAMYSILVVMSFVEMAKFLLSQPQDPAQKLYLLSERISQDPLENYFGKQRARGEGTRTPIYNNAYTMLQHCVCRSLWLWIRLGGIVAGRDGYSVMSNQKFMRHLYLNASEFNVQ